MICPKCGLDKAEDRFRLCPTTKSGFRECQECHSEYKKLRHLQIRAGSWRPTYKHHKIPEPTRVPTALDVAWAAGLIEGEGCFAFSGRKDSTRAIVVCVSQTELEAVTDLAAMFGGRIRVCLGRTLRHKPVYEWRVGGLRAYIVLKTIRPYLRSIRRRIKADELLKYVASRPWTIEGSPKEERFATVNIRGMVTTVSTKTEEGGQRMNASGRAIPHA